MQKSPAHSTVRHIQIAPGEIHFLRFILEAYEGLCVVSTLDSRTGLVELSISPGSEDDVDAILKAERRALGLVQPQKACNT